MREPTSQKERLNSAGQSTVEYAIVSLLTLGAVVALWSAVQTIQGNEDIMRHITGFASHSISADNAVGVAGDVLLY